MPAPDKGSCSRFAPPPWNRESEDWLRLDERLPQDHLARRIDRAVEMLNLEPLYGLYLGVGKKASRPDLLLKVVLYELEMGQQSPAEWHRDVRENEPLRWLAMGLKPSRSVLYVFRDRCGPFLDDANRQALQMALDQGVTTASRGALDGSTIAAHATRRQLANEQSLKQRILQLDQAIKAQQSEPLTEQPFEPSIERPAAQPPTWMAKSPLGRIQQRQRYRHAAEVLIQRQQQNALRAGSKRKPPEKVFVSWSDPEAAVGLDKYSVYRPLYNVQILQDLDSPLLLAYDVFAQQNDAGTLVPMVERMTDLVGHKPAQLLMDSGYVSARDLAACALADVTIYAPWQANDYSDKQKSTKPVTRIPKSQFTWQPDQRAYQCPEGHRLPFAKTMTQKRAAGQQAVLELYTCPPEDCRGCVRHETCTSNPEKGRTVYRLEHEEFVDALRARMATDDAKHLYRLRRQTVELRFADLKEHRNLRRFSGRGLPRAKIQVAANVLVHNLLTVVRHHERIENLDEFADRRLEIAA
jgi:transposase